MNTLGSVDASDDPAFEVAWQDAERVFERGSWVDTDGVRIPVLAVQPATGNSRWLEVLGRLAHEIELRDSLDSAWAMRPLQLVRERNVLLVEDPGGQPLTQLIDAPMNVGRFLPLAIALCRAVGRLHGNGLIHKDIRPGNVVVNTATDEVRLTGFGFASRVPRERQSPAPPEVISGTFAYMAPEQTGRMNRSIDFRSDLYSLGVTFYEMLTGSLPFTASDPMEWMHCHIARQPASPADRVNALPERLCAIVMKLLAKGAEDRYQTAAGLEHDLEHCLAEWETHRSIGHFALGDRDATDQLRFREKLYGRDAEIGRLLAAFERVLTHGAAGLVLVSGYSGIGKSSVVNELHRALVPPRGLFAAGKFDQYKSGIPYATLAQAFQSLVRQLLSKSDPELERWRQALVQALGANGRLMTNLIPELALVIGEQPAVSDLSGPDAQNRILLVFRQLLNVFARDEHPLVLVLDDLQWLDAATLAVFEDFATQREVRNLLLVGIYRDSEVGPAHPLTRRLQAIRESGVAAEEIVLGPVQTEHMATMIADALGTEPQQVDSLAQIAFEKTRGNPFFTMQFISALADEALLHYDPQTAAWRWDIERIKARRVGDNVVDLMIERLSRLPDASLQALKQMACLGNSTAIARFRHVLGASESDTQGVLREALHAGLLLQIDDAYAFAHDRVHEAAYAMLAESERPGIHRNIGTRLLADLSDNEVETEIFEIVSQFNRADFGMAENSERIAAASLNLRAGRKAKSAAAYKAAREYAAKGIAQLDEDGWIDQYELAFALHLENAQCTFLSSEFVDAERLIVALLQRARTAIDSAAVYRLKVELHVVRSENDLAVASALSALRLLGIELSAKPSWADVQREYDRIWTTLNGRSVDSIVDLPAMVDPEKIATVRLLAELYPPAYFTNFNLTTLTIFHMVNLSLIHGSPATNQGYALFGWIIGPAFGRYEEGYRICGLACAMADKRNDLLDMARIRASMALTAQWTQPMTTATRWNRSAYETGVRAGDLYFATYSAAQTVQSLFLSGQQLEQVALAADEYLGFARGLGFRDGTDLIVTTERAVASLRGLTRDLGHYDDEAFDQEAFESELTGSRMTVVVYWYWTRKLMLYVLAGDYEAALRCADCARPADGIRVVQVQQMDYYYYTALAIAAVVADASGPRRDTLMSDLRAHHEQLGVWAEETRSPTFADKHSLISAEIARLEGRESEAQILYEDSIRLARQHGFIQNEGVAHETAARFYAARGLETIARAYLREARHCYLRWGAHGKVRQMEALYPPIWGEQRAPDSTAAAATELPEHLDLATVIKVSQAVSSEIDLARLIETIMRTVINDAGAERAVLVLVRDAEHRIAAEARTHAEGVLVRLQDGPVVDAELPESIVQYVAHTGESVILDDAQVQNTFSSDTYIRRQRTRSLLCLPLLHQAKRVGLLYLENNLAAHVFTAKRLSILRLLASQAAISLENSRLYDDLKAREARIRRLLDSKVIGILIWNLDGRVLDANDAFLRMVRYERKDLQVGLNWADMTPEESQEVSAAGIRHLLATGEMPHLEKEFFRKDGTRVPVMIGAAAFDGTPTEGVAFIVDLTEQKQAEEKLRESELRYRALQSELAHANRIATMGQLCAWIAHDVRQPLVGVVASANAGLRWLSTQPPNVGSAERALERIVREGHRAADVLDRIRALVKKATPHKELVDINEVVRETIILLGPEAERKGIVVQADLVSTLPFVLADRIQTQQVIVNLMVNAIEAMNNAATPLPHDLLVASSADASGTVLVAVSDSGPGVSSEHQGHLFDAFFTTKSGGLGMGLAISRTIIESFGGRIWVTPNMPRGAVFQFTLPGVAASSVPTAASDASPSRSR
ncbi:trifunctional serine/threonine-protein kinase/ATP-binding protein/sensor histidine kinase [Povalibacter sp.]|uniref:trifunctional serine/threonine-protein kinase/ATP-binding protein/sensor histidine kinase n=1 Tax=Povalibacter sp. TaxID=1962978 RepID=UPI002F3EF4C3